ncbi:MAG: TonB family protein [Bacteriovoracaceae bacterium]|nr:TonB family protein [Bacteriovoracaceae bacterium]
MMKTKGEQDFSLPISIGIHSILILILFFFTWLDGKNFLASNLEKINFVVIEKEKTNQEDPININLKKMESSDANQTEKQKSQKKIFGLKKSSLNQADSKIAVKTGNTLQKESDEIKMTDQDSEKLDSELPTPAKEFLVTEMPQLIAEFRAPYPKEAKDKGIEGNVILEILIDQTGSVRSAKLISGPGFGLNEVALESIKKFKFRPAKIENNFVAVKIRYSIKFVLEK